MKADPVEHPSGAVAKAARSEDQASITSGPQGSRFKSSAKIRKITT